MRHAHPAFADRLRAALGRLALAVGWLAAATVVALGSAGLVAALDHRPGTAARPELTWNGDRAAAPALAAATEELAAIAAGVDALGLQGRASLAALAAQDFELLEQTTADGAELVAEVGRRSAALRERLLDLPGFDAAAPYAFSARTIDTRARLLEAIRATDGLAPAWARLTSRGVSAARLSGLLATHDERITAAIEAGRAGDFATALGRIDAATAMLDQASRLRDELANEVDVAILDEWLRRNREYDVALRALYVASAESPNRVTPAIRAALAAERDAREALPQTTAGLTIVMAEIARGGANQAVIVIEDARGRLTTALHALRDPDPSRAPP